MMPNWPQQQGFLSEFVSQSFIFKKIMRSLYEHSLTILLCCIRIIFPQPVQIQSPSRRNGSGYVSVLFRLFNLFDELQTVQKHAAEPTLVTLPARLNRACELHTECEYMISRKREHKVLGSSERLLD
jgi:hypothetical protein